MERNLSFQRALEDLKQELTAEKYSSFGITKIDDVHRQIAEIQCKYGSEKRLRNMARMSRFLEAMQQLEQVVNVFLNVDTTVAFVWVGLLPCRLHMTDHLNELFACRLRELIQIYV